MRVRVEARRVHAYGAKPRDKRSMRAQGVLGCLSDKLPYLCCSLCTLGLSWLCWLKSKRDDEEQSAREEEDYGRMQTVTAQKIVQAEREMLIEGIPSRTSEMTERGSSVTDPECEMSPLEVEATARA